MYTSNVPRTVRQVAMFLPPTLGYFADVVLGVQELARSLGGWEVEVCHTLLEAVNCVKNWKPDGILVNCADGDWQPFLRTLPMPVVQIGGEDARPAVRYRLTLDNALIGEMAATYFIERGFTHFAFCGYDHTEWSLQREAAFRTALARNKHGCTSFLAPVGLLHVSHSRDTLGPWAQSLPKPVAVFACHDRAAMLLCHAAQQIGLSVPEDMSILGVDNNPFECHFTVPPISSVMGSARRLGYQSAELLEELMSGQNVPDQTIAVPPARVVERGSTDVYAADDPDVAAALKFIRDSAGEPIDVADVAKAVITDRRMLERKFRRYLDRTPRQQILTAHIERAKSLLIHTTLPMVDVAIGSGFPSGSKLSAVFIRETGLTPSAFRKLYGAAAAIPARG